MKFLWLSWKDQGHPDAGGAEKVMHELSKRLIDEGHSVTMLTARYHDASKTDVIDGIEIIRIGTNRYLHSFQALWFYLRHLRGRFDVVVEVVNTAPYFSVFFKGRAKAVLLYHQLAREIWFSETSFPLNWLGFLLLEPAATTLLGRSRASVLTVSNSTKQDLLRFGFKPERLAIISEGTHLEPVESLQKIHKYSQPTVLSFGALRGMKRTLDQIKAFEIAKKTLPELRLIIAGSDSGRYAQTVKQYISHSPFALDISLRGRVSDAQKVELMQKSHCIVVTSIKEGWGLIVTEANSQGTPAVVYDVDGLRDAVQHNQTGLVVRQNPAALAAGIVGLLQDETVYSLLRHHAHTWSKTITFEQSYADFKQALKMS